MTGLSCRMCGMEYMDDCGPSRMIKLGKVTPVFRRFHNPHSTELPQTELRETKFAPCSSRGHTDRTRSASCNVGPDECGESFAHCFSQTQPCRSMEVWTHGCLPALTGSLPIYCTVYAITVLLCSYRISSLSSKQGSEAEENTLQ